MGSKARAAKISRSGIAVTIILSIAALAFAACSNEKKEPRREAIEQMPAIAGHWQNEIASKDRIISRSYYTVEQLRDSVFIRLDSNISPLGDELVPLKMSFEAAGKWKNKMLRLSAISWVSGKDSCFFDLGGALDSEGNLLLFFPADLCGEKNLPFTRKLVRLSSEE